MSSLESFFTEETKSSWGNPTEVEVRRRIILSVAAYSYEYENDSIMSDADFDRMSLEVNSKMKTGNSRMDRFFRNNFDPDTGQWIRKHPELNRIKQIYNEYYKR